MMQRGLLLFFLSGILLICSGCSNFDNIIGFAKEQAVPTTCANLVIERAFKETVWKKEPEICFGK